MSKFKKTLGGLNRRPVSKDKFEAVTGQSLSKENDIESIRAQISKAQTEDEKKKIRQRAALLGIPVEKE